MNQENKVTGTKRRALQFAPDDMELAEHIWALIDAMQPGRKPPKLDSWANEIRLMRDADKRTHDQIRQLFEWANHDPFWRLNILSPGKLREKFDDLELRRMNSSRRRPTYQATKGVADDGEF